MSAHPWVAVAWCNNSRPGVWHEIEGAPVTLHQARHLMGLPIDSRPVAGCYMAQKRGTTRTELLFKDCRK